MKNRNDNEQIKKKNFFKRMKDKITKSHPVETIGAIIIILGLIVMIIPFVWMVLSSLKTSNEFYESSWIPEIFQWKNYVEIFTNKEMNFFLYLFNTVKITSLTIVGTLLSTTLIAYALARIDFKGRNIVFTSILLVMFMPKQVTIVPVFVIIKTLGLYNSHLSLILPAFLGVPGGAMCVFLLRQFFMSIPKEYEESAKLDGANQFVIFSRIFVPLVKAPMITCAILVLQGSWAEIMRPLIFLKDESLYTLVLGVKRISDVQYIPKPELELAGYMVLLLPLLIIYICAQKYFVQSISSTGVKG
ncbi:carbohydrate ABC transporter permease [Vallitalea guaymasensis]|uniref:carbohydrate ABC transporter permease n=1 Tax=Vallitalea guaymasensis TaxID=1185412 RepID=UPI000DE34470|nr:carbohydrate ABC transporter permease [Vallitalea guaymasensis]